ncbi:MAG: amidohydrolase family protein [Acidocella sp.]|nr:amidohydrolase family protein [Acidocella sp.]
MASIIDIHPHIISNDETTYPPSPLFGIRSDWSKERHYEVDELLTAMDEAGISKAAIVHSSTTYGFNNAYVLDSCERHPARLLAVGSVDIIQPDAPAIIREYLKRGLGGLRLFTGGSTKAFDPRELEDPRAYPAWELCAELSLPMCIQTGQVGLPQVTALAKRFPNVPIILDHLARPDITDGPPYQAAASLFALADHSSIYLKLSPRIMADSKTAAATPETFFPRLVSLFGASRLAWGSNFPTTPGSLKDNLANAQATLSVLSTSDREWIFGKTAQFLYPALRD